jgi:hypothetical protein
MHHSFSLFYIQLATAGHNRAFSRTWCENADGKP